MSNPFYYFSIGHEGLAIEIWFNDVLLDTDPDGAFRDRQFLNNLYVLDGENSLKVKVGLPGQPPRKPESLDLKVGLHEVFSEEDSLPEPIAEITFPGTDIPSFPAVLDTTVQINSPFGKWSWEQGEVIDIEDPQTIPSVMNLLGKLHQTLSSRDIDTITNIMDVKARDMASAYFMPVEERLEGQRDFYREVFDDPQFEMEPLQSFDNLRFVPMAHGRLLLIEQKNGNSALESKELSEGYCFCLPVILAKFGNELKVVR
ncbi:hypothetical protein CHISP_3430 [Chitinispirillum alkaliphilum]|nr:hypothetical protein CHISP_3430 [Chitinispirillum alkaliphilum]